MTNLPWLFTMAWRDSRKNRSRLFLFVSSIIIGIAALVAIYSFGYDLRRNIDEQAAELIGADLTISTGNPLDKKMQPLIDSLGDRKSKEESFASMALFPKNNSTRLVNVRALQGDYPYYGTLETVPVSAAQIFKNEKGALVDKTLSLQFNVTAGDSIKLGNLTFVIAGVLDKAPGSTGISTSIAPVVYIPLQFLDQTGLSQKGSRIEYTWYYKYDHPINIQKLVDTIQPRLEAADLNFETVEGRKNNTGRYFSDITKFLSLVGFIALLLGCVGVASAINVYVREKINSIAIMRCLGVTGRKAFYIYLIQIVGIGLIGSVIGAFLGAAIQQILPAVLKDFLPMQIETALSWKSIGQGIALGVIISFLFALLPLIAIRKISPLFTFRMSYENVNLAKDPFRWLVYILILVFITTFAYIQLGEWLPSVFFTFGLLMAFGVLTLVGVILMRVMRVIIRNTWGYLVRQGFANLYRPNNQTIILIVSIGLSTAFICTLFFVQNILMKQVNLSSSANQSNMILFDIQTNQEKAVADLTKQQGLPIIQQVPIVMMHIDAINGKTAAEIRSDTSTHHRDRWLGGEIRATFRDSLISSESVDSGTWVGSVKPGQPIPVSFDNGFAHWLHVRVGDHIVFNVQGTDIETVVGSLRKVDWGKVQTNFRLVFPKGVLEDAPQFHVLLTHVPSAAVSVKYQTAVVQKFPNVSLIDLGLVLSILDDLLAKIGYVIHFMAAFSIVTGIVVLIASVRISKFQRIQESVLLRTLGATRRQILTITSLEYFFLGALSALTGILIAVVAGWLIAKYSFKLAFNIDLWPAVIVLFAISALTIIIGLFNSNGILNKPPLEVLRRDV